MKSTTKKLSDTKVEIKVTLDAKDLAAAEVQALNRLAKEVEIKGFRKGKVPAEKAKAFIDPNELASATIDYAVRVSVPKAFEEANSAPLVIPNVEVSKYVPGEMAEYTATADILPEIKLGDYKKLGVKKADTAASDKDVDEVIANVRRAYAEKKVAKKKAEMGDEVVIDFVGKKDGKEFEGGKAKDFNLTLGSHQFIPGFEEGIVGHESGDKFDLPLTFPKDYGVKDLAGAKTVFEVLVKQVNEVKEPELNDEFAAKCGPFKTMAELRADVKKNLEMQNEHKANEQYKEDLVNAFVKASKVSAPEILIDDQMRMIRDDITRNAKAQGMELQDYLKRMGQKEEDWEKEARKVAEQRVKASLCLQVLARDEKITVSDEDVAAKVAELKEVYKKSPEALKNLKDPNVRMDIRNRMVLEKTLDFLAEKNK